MIIPIVLYKDEKDLLNKIGKTNDPLAMYFFTKNIKQEIVEKITKRYRSGTVSFNEFIYFINIKNYPFGGIGNSGNGKYGNKYSLYTFSYLRPYFKKNTKYDFKSLYYPYTDKKLNFISKLIKIKQK